MKKVIVIIGALFIVMQFSTVFVFQELLRVAKANQLPVAQLADMQMTIMYVVLFSLILMGLLLVVLLMFLIRQAWKVQSAA